MRKATILIVLVVLILGLIPSVAVQAAPNAQFAGCADEADLALGAKLTAIGLNGFNMVVTAVGVDGFDPQITVLDDTGKSIACNDNSNEAAEVVLNLPSVTTEASEKSARVEVAVPGDQGRLDYTIIVTSADGKYGEFVLLYNGAAIVPATEKDAFTFSANEGMTANEVPLGLYQVNLRRPEIAMQPSITFKFGEELEQTCSKSSAKSLCEGESEDLTDYTVTLEGEDAIVLNGDDVMLFYQLGGDPAEFTIECASYQGGTFGPYTLIIHSGVGNPKTTG